MTSTGIPLQDFLGMRVVTSGSPSRVELPLGASARGAVAPLHGGALSTLIDLACGVAAAVDVDPAVSVPVSTDLTVRFLRQPRSGPLVAEATVVHSGRTSVLVECVVVDAEGRQVGRGAGSYRIVAGFHTPEPAPA